MKNLIEIICDKPINGVWNEAWTSMNTRDYDELWESGFEDGWDLLREQVIHRFNGGGPRWYERLPI